MVKKQSLKFFQFFFKEKKPCCSRMYLPMYEVRSSLSPIIPAYFPGC